jgi:hypothetical protein
MLTKALSEHPAAGDINKLLNAPEDQLPQVVLDAITSENEHPHSVAAFGTWLLNMGSPSGEDMDKIARVLMDKPLHQTWGAIMGVACSPATPDTTLSQLADWLYDNEKGAYLTKLITRNPAASPATRSKALANYRAKEIIT